MPRFESPGIPAGRGLDAVGVIVANLGTPEAPTSAAVRRYLRQFLSDPRVVEAPRWLWWLVLNGFILRVRPARSAAAYAKIWTARGSPLLLNTLAIVEAMQQRLSAQSTQTVLVRAAMSYGMPSIPAALRELEQQGAGRIVVLPLYPQYAGSSTGSVFDAVAGALLRRRWVPELIFINHYYDAPGYVEALAESVRAARERNGRGERLLFSFHGLPQKMIEAGDPYHGQCLATAERVAANLGLVRGDWEVAFQSRVGREEWLRPYTDEVLQRWGEQHMGKIDVICPGFAADCLETLEEIAMQNRERFAAAGGGELRYIPALNASDDHVAMLCSLVESAASGWLASRGSGHASQPGAPR